VLFGRNQDDSGDKVTEAQVLQALATVQEPELHRDLVTLKMVRGVTVENGAVSFTIVLTTPACPLRSEIEADARRAVSAIPGVKAVNIKWDANVPSDARIMGRLSLPLRNTIAVASGKGGVGKTTVAVNLAVALAESGAKVGLLDADIYGPNVPIMMGVSGTPHGRDDKIVPPEGYGVKVISMGLLVPQNQPLIWRGPMLHSAIRQFLNDVDWGDLDYLVIDLPPGTGDAALTLAQSAPLSGAVIVAAPQEVALQDVVRAVEMFKKLEVPILGVVENFVGDVFGRGGGRRVAEQYGVPLLGEIPLDAQVRAGGDSGEPVVIAAPESAAGRALNQMAKEVAARVSVVTLAQSDVIPLTTIG
jgi:ATP-binding protein involved in chromosome partitioning